jgi:hypothetical protein
MIANLTIGQTAPVLQTSEKGPKTVYVAAEMNWPANVGQPIPSIPRDIWLRFKIMLQGIYSEIVCPLSNVGTRVSVDSDELTVDAIYTPEQALAVPYALYIIKAGYSRGFAPKPVSSYNFNFNAALAPANYPDIIGGAPFRGVPPFTSEIRCRSRTIGMLNTWCLQQAIAGYWRQSSLDQYLDWTPLHPLEAFWFYLCEAVNPVPLLMGSGDFVIEFR